jgi:hypothetical protein
MAERQAITDLFGPAIYSYTRAQALEDGVLVDAGSMAQEAGFRFPVALTQAVWERYIVPDERARRLGQSESGRLWDTLWMAKAAARAAQGQAVYFRLYFIMKARQRRLVTLKALCGPGDQGEPVITIMLPEED